MEAVAETSEAFMERYFGGETFSESEIRAALRTNVIDGSIVPVSMGSNTLCQGVYTLLDDIVKYVPSPEDRICAGISLKTNGIFQADYDFSKVKSAYIYKTISDPFIGKYSLIKVCSGVLKTDDTMYNSDSDVETKIGKLYVMQGNKPIEVSELHAGDLGALAKLTGAKTGDTLSTKANPVAYAKTEYSKPYTAKRYKAVNKADIDKISQSLQKLTDEDKTLRVVNDSENRQTLLYGMGEQHLEVIASRLENEYKVKIELSKPKVAYRETIRKKVEVREKYKKQSGGHGQYGDVAMEFEPSGDLETPFVFEEKVVTLPDLVEILKNNWEGCETLRLRFINEAAKFGNGCEQADKIAQEMVEYFVECVDSYNQKYEDIIYSPCIGTFSWVVNIGKRIGASADGRKSHEPIAANMSPVPSRDISGPTAAINSYLKLNTSSMAAGAPIDLRVSINGLEGEEGTRRIAALVETFIEMGGNMMTLTITSVEELRRAMENPEKYRGLRVRMGGWSAYYTLLSKESQKIHLKRVEHGLV